MSDYTSFDAEADRIWDAIDAHVLARGGDPETIVVTGHREILPPGAPVTSEPVVLTFINPFAQPPAIAEEGPP